MLQVLGAIFGRIVTDAVEQGASVANQQVNAQVGKGHDGMIEVGDSCRLGKRLIHQAHDCIPLSERPIRGRRCRGGDGSGIGRHVTETPFVTVSARSGERRLTGRHCLRRGLRVASFAIQGQLRQRLAK